MEHEDSLKEKEVIIDVGNGNTNCGDDANVDPVSGNRRANRMLNKFPSGELNYNESEKGLASGIANGSKGGELGEDSIELLIDKDLGRLQSEERLPLVEKNNKKEKRKASNSKKAPKPPRPPKGPSIYASDMKLVKEIAEITMKKRARMEHLKALKKMKAAKSSPQSSSSNSTLTAMFVTAVFCIVIILQGFCSRNSPSMTFQGSPEAALEPKGLISAHLYNISPNQRVGESLEPPREGEAHPPGFRCPK